ncbi:alpha/beta hydrolase [Qipengyuania sediminis]|uniref:alpha/beta hydrolase n=1 Tax=Qipengyuania sediminis TaxID=1532023 RepID=UPI001F0E1DF9|nr:alpha/beta hydrolase [Qipengyuania sediminis]
MLVIAFVLTAVTLAFLAPRSPPAWLSFADAVSGGGGGTERLAEGLPFGSHGQKLDVWAPAGASKSARPVLIWWHGGGWVKGDRAAYAFAARAFARAGYVVVVPDYRKVPQVRFPAFIEDGAEAVAWTERSIRRYGGDPARIAFAGHSAGAHTAVLLALDPRWLRAAGANPANVKAAIGLSGPYDFYPFDKKRSIDAMSAWPRPHETQPVHYARADAPPLLLVTSTRDETVRPKNAINLAARMREVGGLVELRNYEGLDHEEVVMALSKPFRGKGPVFADSLAFLRTAGLAPPPVR